MDMTEDEVKALEEVIAYLADEEENYDVWKEENDVNEGVSHIWQYVEVLHQLLERVKKESEYVRTN